MKIPAGFQFDGTVTLLGVTSHLVLKLVKNGDQLANFEGTIDVKEPIMMGTVLKISHATIEKQGPYMSLKYDVSLSLKVSAKIDFFGFSSSTELEFDKTHFKFAFTAKWNYAPFIVACKVETTYENMAINKFHLTGSIEKNNNQKSLGDYFGELAKGIEGSLEALVAMIKDTASELVNKVKTKVTNLKDSLVTWWNGWWSRLFGGKRFKSSDKNNYGFAFVTSFWDNMIRTDRAKVDRIVAHYKTGIDVYVRIDEISFSVDYDDVAECNMVKKQLVIGVKFKGIVMDNVVNYDEKINLSDHSWIIGGLTWALRAIDRIHDEKSTK